MEDFVDSLEAIRICIRTRFVELATEIDEYATDDWLKYGRRSWLPPLFIFAERLVEARRFGIEFLSRELPKGQIRARLG